MDTRVDETNLVQRARQGDSDAFGSLVLEHQAFVYNLALRSVGDALEAQDLAQEAFIRAWTALPSFRHEAKFSTWLYRIVVNLCYNRRPRLRRELAALPTEALENLPIEGKADAANPSAYVEQEEVRRLLQHHIQQLPGTYRVLLLLRYQRELPYEDIAAILDMPLGTVKTGLFRVHAQLRRAMELEKYKELAGSPNMPGTPESQRIEV